MSFCVFQIYFTWSSLALTKEGKTGHFPVVKLITYINNTVKWFFKGFPGSPVGKESTCNVEDPASISWLGRSAGERIHYPLQYSWSSPAAQLVKNMPTMWETWVQSLGCKDPLEKGKASHSNILAWRTPWTDNAVAKRRTPLSDFQFQNDFSSQKKCVHVYSLWPPRICLQLWTT